MIKRLLRSRLWTVAYFGVIATAAGFLLIFLLDLAGAEFLFPWVVYTNTYILFFFLFVMWIYGLLMYIDQMLTMTFFERAIFFVFVIISVGIYGCVLYNRSTKGLRAFSMDSLIPRN